MLGFFLCTVLVLTAGPAFGAVLATPSYTRFDTGVVRPVLTGGGPNAWDQFLREKVSVIADDAGFRMWYVGHASIGPASSKVGYATSTDGVNWDKHAANPVINRSTQDQDMSVVKAADGTLYMYLEVNDSYIDLLTSGDGIHWAESPGNPVKHTAASPVVWREGGSWFMLYEFMSGSVFNIHLATSGDGHTWMDDPANPVLRESSITVPDAVVKDGATYHLYYHRNENLGAGWGWPAWHAVSTSLRTWSARTRVSTDFSSQSTVRLADGQLWSYFWNISGDGHYYLRYGLNLNSPTIWHLDEGSGTRAADASGNRAEAVLENGAAWVAGRQGTGLAFDGVDDDAVAGYWFSPPTWTVSVWARSPAAPSGAPGAGPVHHEKNLQINWNHPRSAFRGAAGVSVGTAWHAASFGPLAANRWYHLAATYDGETLRAYRNGVLVTANTAPSGPANAESSPLTFGRHATAAQYFSGTIDDVRIYERPLTASEVMALAQESVNEAPNGVITAPTSDVTILQGGTVTFGGTGSDPDGNLPLTYRWTFGPGGPADSTQQNPGAVTFPNAGVYPVTFTVTDGLGLADATPATRTVTVQNASPGGLIPQTSWTLRFADSQEMVWENGAATNAFDGNPGTIWHTEYRSGIAPLPHEIQIDLGATYNVGAFRYLPRQDGGINGRIGQYEFYVSTDGLTWGTPVGSGTFANTATEKEVAVTPKTGRYVRLRALTEANGQQFTSMAELAVLTASGNQPPESVITSPAGNLTIAAGEAVTFGGTGTDPDNNLPLTYRWTFGAGGPPDSTQQNPGAVTFLNPGIYAVTFTVIDALGTADPTPATRTITVEGSTPGGLIPQTNWTLRFVDSQETAGENGRATNAFDGNPGTIWHTKWQGGIAPLPHEIQIDLGSTYAVSAFRYLPRQDGGINGRIGQYEFYVSTDGVTWGTPVASGTFANTAAEKEVPVSPKTGRYVRLRALTEANGQQFTSMAEFNVLTSSANQPPDGLIGAPASNVAIAPGQSVTFAGTGTDPDGHLPLTYRWTFGAGGPPASTQQNPGAVTFPNAGVYAVTFTVTDALGLADPTPATRTITVQGGTARGLIPQANWTLRFVDSQETIGENAPATNAFDGDPDTIWHTQWFGAAPPPPHEIQIDLGATYPVNGFRYLPRQNFQFARVGAYEFYVSTDGVTWGTPVAAGEFPDTNNGDAHDVLFAPTTGRFVRFRARSGANGDGFSSIAELGVFQPGTLANQPPTAVIASPAQSLTVPIGAALFLSGSGSDPDGNLPLTYRWSVSPGSGITDELAPEPGIVHFERSGTFVVTLTVADAHGAVGTATRTITVQSPELSRAGWSLRFVDSQETVGENGAAINAFDGDPATIWHTRWQGAQPPPPHEIQIDLGGTRNVSGFGYLPRQDGGANGRIGQYEFYVSTDGVNWGAPTATGTFANDAAKKDVLFAARPGRFVRLRALTEANGQPYTTVAELSVIVTQCSGTSPSVRFLSPKSRDLQPSSTLKVVMDPCLAEGQGVRLLINGGPASGGTQTDFFAPPYSATVSGLVPGEHVFDALVIDGGGTPVPGPLTHDQANPVGIGDYYVAIGDGITAGAGDDIASDSNSRDGRTTTLGGYPAILGDLLTAAAGHPAMVANEGVPGASSDDVLAGLPGVLARHPNAQTFLLFVGHNDYLHHDLPSGLGLQPGDPGYAGSYKDNLQRIIDIVKAAGKTIVIGKSPPVLPLGSDVDTAVQFYNLVLDELASNPANGLPAPPDFYSYFRDRTSTEYFDSIVMNGRGYRSMAQIWLSTLVP